MDKEKFYVYVDITDEAIPFYAGYGDLGRFRCKRRNRRHTNIAKKYGQHRLLILETDDVQVAKAKEIELVADMQLNTYKHPENHFACNMTDGGEGTRGYRHQDVTRKRIGDNSATRRPEVAAKVAAANTGSRRSEETRRKMSESAKRREEHFRQRGERKHSAETRKRLSEHMKAHRSTNRLRKSFQQLLGDPRLSVVLSDVLERTSGQ